MKAACRGDKKTFGLVVILFLIAVGIPSADEAPIVGTVKAIDTAAPTLTVNTTAQGRTRQVVIDVKPTTKIVRFLRSSEPGRSGFVEQPSSLAELKPGWTVAVTTRHDGGREVAELVKVVVEQ
jgi:hypothetical protein